MTTDDVPPPRVAPRITAAPKIRAVYWCDFPKDAHLPEIWKTRPVVVVSYRNRLAGTVTVIPLSTSPQDDNNWAVKVDLKIDDVQRWAICDKPATVATSRLTPMSGSVPRLAENEFERVLSKLFEWLPRQTSSA